MEHRVAVKRWLLLAFIALTAATGLTVMGVAGDGPAIPAGTVSGYVGDSQGSLAGATVRWRASQHSTTTGPDGRFALTDLPEGEPLEIAAWSAGYYISSTVISAPAEGVTITLRPYHTSDHPGYDWVSPEPGSSASACGNCHPMIIEQWATNAHGASINNGRFYTLYNGTNLSGSQAVGPGYLLDFPNTSGLCANCHAPGEAIDGYLSTNMNAVRGQVTAGIFCDYCHKVGGAYLDPATRSVYPNTPGTQSQRILRPPQGDQIFFGPYDDIKDPDTYLPLISESAYCAPCHQFSFWGTPIYESYNEWLASPYAGQGITCQACHMPPNGDTHFALPEKGGLPHPPESIPSHLQLGASAQQFLAGSVEMQIHSTQGPGWVEVTVTVTNSGAGHHYPTDFPGRQLILVLNVLDSQGQSLSQLEGPSIPGWGGAQAGKAGKIFAKVLVDVASGDYPVVSYWKQSLILRDNRIPAFGADLSRYRFELSDDSSPVTVNAELLFRRVFQEVADQKEWGTSDIFLDQQVVSPGPSLYLPLLFSGDQ